MKTKKSLKKLFKAILLIIITAYIAMLAINTSHQIPREPQFNYTLPSQMEALDL